MRQAISTARPSRLRLAGALALVVGGALLGLGAVSTWGSVGLSEELDPDRAIAAIIPGIDLWEGVSVLAAALAILGGLVALRLVRRTSTRRLIAVAIVVVGFGAAALAATVALRIQDRLVQTEGLDAYAHALSDSLDLPLDQVRTDIKDAFLRDLLVETGSGVWLAMVGGIVAGVGGILSLAWVRQEREGAPEPSPPGPILA